MDIPVRGVTGQQQQGGVAPPWACPEVKVEKPHAQAKLLSPTEKCKICNEQAAKHIHYGAMTCFSCRAFFRRSIQNKTAVTYACRRNKDCEINLKTRKNCQYCRYQKCLQVGMKPTWVLSEEERQRRFRKVRERQQDPPSRNSFVEEEYDLGEDVAEDMMNGSAQPEDVSLDEQHQLGDKYKDLHAQQAQLHERYSPTEKALLSSVKSVIQRELGMEYMHVKTEPGTHQQQQHTPPSPYQMSPNIQVKEEPILPADVHVVPKAKFPALAEAPSPSYPGSSRTSGPTAPGFRFGGPSASGSRFVVPSASVSRFCGPSVPSSVIVQTNSQLSYNHGGYSLLPARALNPSILEMMDYSQRTDKTPLDRYEEDDEDTDMNEIRQLVDIMDPAFVGEPVGLLKKSSPGGNGGLSGAPFGGYPASPPSGNSCYPASPPGSSGGYPVSPPGNSGGYPASPPSGIGCYQVNPPERSGGYRISPGGSGGFSGVPGHLKQPLHVYQPSDRNIIPDDYVETCLYEDEMNSSSDEEYTEPRRQYRNMSELYLTASEHEEIAQMVSNHEERYKSVNFGEELIKEMIMCSMFSIPISTTAAITGYRLCIERVTRIANSTKSFSDLTKADQTMLLKENSDLLVSLRGAIFFDSKKKGVDQLLISMGSEDMGTIERTFSQLLKEDTMKHIDYKTFNSVQALGKSFTEARYNSIQEKVGKMLDQDNTVSILITYVVLFSSDFCNLNYPHQVQEAQEKYLNLLEKYLYTKYSGREACMKLSNSIDIITCIREMVEIKKHRAVNPSVRF